MKLRFLIVASLLLTVRCGGPIVDEERVRVRSLAEVSDAGWKELATARIFFGHQSVGSDIMKGVSELMDAQRSFKLQVIDEGKSLPATGPFFAHRKIGKNGNPTFKTDEFARLLDGGLAPRVDIAFHKYCYADIDEGTDVRPIFEHYRTTMARLKQKHPHVVFIHVTTPLLRVQAGPKAAIKKLLGRRPDHYGDNMQRERFNDLLRREYRSREPLFDLAAIESTLPDGRRETIRFGDATSHALVPDYTTDGGHLNAEGRRRVSVELLVFLVEILSRK